MSRAIVPIEFYAGEVVSIPARMVPAEDITGWQITFTLKARRSGLALVTRTVGAGITITDALAGTFTITLTVANTSQTPGEYVADLWRTDAGTEFVLAELLVKVKQPVRTPA